MIPHDTAVPAVGSLLFEGLDQIDLTGPFEVLSLAELDLPPPTARPPSPCATSRGSG